MDELKRLILEECPHNPHKMQDGLFDEFLGAMTEVRLRNREVLVPYGKMDANLYVQRSGITRYCWFDGEKEKTYGFATPGTVMISYHSHVRRAPSFFQLESCGQSVVMRISKTELDAMARRSHEFALWLVDIHLEQLYSNELRYAVINGQAKERFRSLVENRPEIMARVPLKVIASYLGVTPNYLSYLKKVAKTAE
ncbi:MAG: Crp/Fnr family transcriptional regulator [Alistipes sp.]|jgi:hypothetical protein|nr:Crp/Fnr family transcriptional regulator [Alistipes sp.]